MWFEGKDPTFQQQLWLIRSAKRSPASQQLEKNLGLRANNLKRTLEEKTPATMIGAIARPVGKTYTLVKASSIF